MAIINLTKDKILINSKKLAKQVNSMTFEEQVRFIKNIENELLQIDEDLKQLLLQLNENDKINHVYIPEKHKSKIVVVSALFAGLAGGLFGYAIKQEIFAMFTNSAMFSLIGVLIGEITCKIIENKFIKKFINKIKISKLESAILKQYNHKLILAKKLELLKELTNYKPSKDVNPLATNKPQTIIENVK